MWLCNISIVEKLKNPFKFFSYNFQFSSPVTVRLDSCKQTAVVGIHVGWRVRHLACLAAARWHGWWDPANESRCYCQDVLVLRFNLWSGWPGWSMGHDRESIFMKWTSCIICFLNRTRQIGYAIQHPGIHQDKSELVISLSFSRDSVYGNAVNFAWVGCVLTSWPELWAAWLAGWHDKAFNKGESVAVDRAGVAEKNEAEENIKNLTAIDHV